MKQEPEPYEDRKWRDRPIGGDFLMPRHDRKPENDSRRSQFVGLTTNHIRHCLQCQHLVGLDHEEALTSQG